MHRLFIGIALQAAARAACEGVARRLERAGLPGRFVPPENYHLTLLFLGNVEQTNIESLEEAASGVASLHSAFALALDRVGAFPHERRPSVVYVGARGADERYRALAADVRGACAALGYSCDDDAVPHVTIARVPEKQRRPIPLVDVAPIPVTVDALCLFESLPQNGKTRYEIRSAFAFPK